MKTNAAGTKGGITELVESDAGRRLVGALSSTRSASLGVVQACQVERPSGSDGEAEATSVWAALRRKEVPLAREPARKHRRRQNTGRSLR